MNLAICSLASGSSGNCYLVKNDKAAFLVDAGISGRQIALRLNALGLEPSDLSGVFVTHEHSDHTKGLSMLAKTKGVKFYINEKTRKEMGEPAWLTEENWCPFTAGSSFAAQGLEISTFHLSHDAADPAGFSFKDNGRQLSIVTDTGIVTEEIYQCVKNSDILVLESNHDEAILKMGRYPWFLKQRILSNQGHLSNEAAAKLLKRLISEDHAAGSMKPRRIMLAHLSRENNFPEMALETAKNILETERLPWAKALSITTLSRDEASPLFLV